MLHRGETEISSRLTARLDPFIEQIITLLRVPGIAAGAVSGEELIYAKGFGVRDVVQRTPVTPETLFHMASVTKPFVGTAVMQLVEAGKVDLDAPVQRYLPYFEMADERAAAMTVRQMLSHTSGMPDTQEFDWARPEYDDGALERYVRSLAALSLIGAPGERYAYSNIAYEVLGDLIAKVSGDTFEEYVQAHILSPLGMRHSTLLVREAHPALLASPHNVDRRGEVVVSEVFPYNRAHAPSSTLYSNIVDMACWAAANLHDGALAGRRILSPAGHAAMRVPVMSTAEEAPREVGLSWFLSGYRGERTVRHSGGDIGFTSNLILVPGRDLAVFAMANTHALTAPGMVTNAALEVLLGDAT